MLHFLNNSASRPMPAPFQERFEFFFLSLGENLDPAIRRVPHPSGYPADAPCLILSPGAEEDPLDVAENRDMEAGSHSPIRGRRNK